MSERVVGGDEPVPERGGGDVDRRNAGMGQLVSEQPRAVRFVSRSLRSHPCGE